MNKLYIAYSVALLTSIAYSFWYIGSNAVVDSLHGYTLIIPLLIIEAVSSAGAFAFMMSRPHGIGPRTLAYSVLSGAMYTIGNLTFYLIIRSSGIAPASSFAAAEIVIFVLLLALSSRNKASMEFYYVGAVFVAAGLVLESLKLSGGALALNSGLIGDGLLLAVVYGVATYLYYLSVANVENKFTSMFVIQFTEVLLYSVLLLLVYSKVSFASFTAPSLLLIVGVGVVFMASFYLETTMMKMLTPLGKGATATGYILSDLQLLPVLAYAVITNPSSWVYYAPGMIVITVGMALLEWK